MLNLCRLPAPGARVWVLWCLVSVPHGGCGVPTATPRPAGTPVPVPMLAPGSFSAEVQATCYPPEGWQAKPLERLPSAVQRVWVSPSGRTAYGVMRIDLPLPVGPDLALWGFIREMSRTEGESRLLSRTPLDDGSGVRFVAEGPRYRTRGVLRTRGVTGWVVYAGAARSEPELPDELDLAERAREHTRCGEGG